MIKSLIISALAVMSLQSFAVTAPLPTLTEAIALSIAQQPAPSQTILPWKPGESLDFNMSAGFISGTVHMAVREETPVGFWIQQDMDLGMFGKQKVEVLYDKTNGNVLEMIVNGEKQEPPSAADQEVVETKNDQITVPKGTFDCMYVKIKNVKDNSESEIWVTRVVPISGMLKTVSQSQIGPVTLELTNFTDL